MRNLTDIHNQLSATDRVYLEKRAEQIKIAEEEDAAGRIMARGFADELTKLAGPYTPSSEGPFAGAANPKTNFGKDVGGIVPSKPGFDLGGAGKSGQGYAMGGAQKRKGTANQQAASAAGGGSQGGLKGAPPMGRLASNQPNAAAPKPAAPVGGPKPMAGAGAVATRR